MTENEAIARIAWAIHGAHYETDAQKGTLRLNRELAEAAWNEMKVIARENPEQPKALTPAEKQRRYRQRHGERYRKMNRERMRRVRAE